MRMAFGLVSVLVSIGILILVISMMLDQNTGVVATGKVARNEAKQIAGIGMDGEAATNSAALRETTSSSGKLDNLLVTQVVPGGAYDTHFGLKKDDAIIRINGMKVNDIAIGDGSLAKALVSDAYQRQQPITVVRNGETIDLPQPGVVRAVGPAPVAAAAPTTAPAATPADNRNPYRRQLDAIKGAVN